MSNRRRTLIITNCSSADEGDVKCVSEDDESIAQLQIEGRDIKILKKLSDMEVTEGEPASFELDVNYENVSGSWEVNGIAVKCCPLREACPSRPHRMPHGSAGSLVQVAATRSGWYRERPS